MFVVLIFKQNLKVCFHFPFWWRHVLNILNHHPPSTVSLLWARDGEEVCKNKTLPSIQYSVSPGNMSQHWIIIACNISSLEKTCLIPTIMMCCVFGFISRTFSLSFIISCVCKLQMWQCYFFQVDFRRVLLSLKSNIPTLKYTKNSMLKE